MLYQPCRLSDYYTITKMALLCAYKGCFVNETLRRMAKAARNLPPSDVIADQPPPPA